MMEPEVSEPIEKATHAEATAAPTPTAAGQAGHAGPEQVAIELLSAQLGAKAIDRR